MTRTPPALEIEAKLLAYREGDLRAIAALRALGRYRLRPRSRARLYSIYLDTSDRRLARHRVALRLRRQVGKWELTAKWSGHVRGIVHARAEMNVRLSGRPRFPYRLRGHLPADLEGLAGGQPLHPILITEIYRRCLNVLPENGRGSVLAELALDRVHLRAPDGRPAAPPYFEVEIERRHGTRRDLGRIAAALQERFELTASRESKFSRGLKALHKTARAARRPSRRL